MWSSVVAGSTRCSGSTGDDDLSGGPGNDTVNGGDDADEVQGGLGDDRALTARSGTTPIGTLRSVLPRWHGQNDEYTVVSVGP